MHLSSVLEITRQALPAILAGATFLALCIGVAGFKTRGFAEKIAEAPFHGSSSLAGPVILRVVTFNIQDTPIVSRHRTRRMQAIARELAVLDPDIAGFQECFVEKDRCILIEELKKASRLQYHQYYPSRVFGSGLLISSAFPIAAVSFQQFSVSNPAYKFYEGDWWAGKGVALARLELPGNSGTVDVYNTHAQAAYGNRAYINLRRQQMVELADFVARSAQSRTPALVLGDMNCRIESEDCAAAICGADLLHLMAIDSDVDHIFAAGGADYWFDLLETVEIEERIPVRGKSTTLSDHSGYMSSVYISPLAPQVEYRVALQPQLEEVIVR